MYILVYQFCLVCGHSRDLVAKHVSNAAQQRCRKRPCPDVITYAVANNNDA